MSEFAVDGQTYRSNKMPARTQLHVLRRMAPIIGPLQSLTVGADPMAALPAFAEAVGSLSDEATDYIMDNCLASVDRKQGETGWAKIRTSSGVSMFADIDLPVEMQIVAHVLRENYTALFQRGLATFGSGASQSP